LQPHLNPLAFGAFPKSTRLRRDCPFQMTSARKNPDPAKRKQKTKTDTKETKERKEKKEENGGKRTGDTIIPDCQS